MNSHEMVVVARLADHYEKVLTSEHDALEVATHDFMRLKQVAPMLLESLRASDRSDREIGDWLYKFVTRWKKTGLSLKNFSAEELERMSAAGRRKNVATANVYCLEGPKRGQSTYGCSRRLDDALRALERGRQRGVTWGEIVERPRAPRGMRMSQWLSPFDE